MKRFLAVLFAIGFITSAAFAGGLSDIEKGITRLEYIGRQVQAVENELRLYYMAKIEDRPNVEPTGNIEQLKELNQELEKLKLHQEIEDLRPGLAKVIDKLISNCDGILKKNTKTRDREFGDFWNVVKDYNNQLKIKIDKYLTIPQLGEKFDLVNEETKLFTNNNDQAIFKKAVSDIDAKKFQDAVNGLKPLLDKYKGKSAEGSILVRIVDCYISKESSLDPNDEYLLGLLTDFVNRKQYSPYIQRIYLQWRTLEQSFNNGASNWSIIPNDQ